jgi:hypothetical protein
MHFLFSLLRIKGLYKFRALLAHPQEVYTNYNWYTAWALCRLVATGIGVERQPANIIRKQHTNVVYVSHPEDEQVMVETCRGP